MGRNDWYRKRTWSQDDQADFFRRLARSRSQRRRYLVIQAHCLRAAGVVDPALRLLDQYFAESLGDDMCHVDASLEKAQCLEAVGRINEAEQAYLGTLAEQRGIPNDVSTVCTDFSWFVVKHGRRHLYSEALAALELVARYLVFPVLQYQANAVRAVISAETGDFDGARRHACKAVSAASATHSGFRYHPDVGLWRNLDPLIHERVMQLANMALPAASTVAHSPC